jgi:hypothetical protein
MNENKKEVLRGHHNNDQDFYNTFDVEKVKDVININHSGNKNNALHDFIQMNHLYLYKIIFNYIMYSRVDKIITTPTDIMYGKDVILEIKNLYLIYDDSKINLMSFVYNNNVAKFVSYGVTMESLFGEFKYNFLSYETFLDIEKELLPIINNLLNELLKTDFFSDVKFYYGGKEKLTNIIYRRGLIVLLNEFFKYIKLGAVKTSAKVFYKLIMKKEDIFHQAILNAVNIMKKDYENDKTQNSNNVELSKKLRNLITIILNNNINKQPIFFNFPNVDMLDLSNLHYYISGKITPNSFSNDSIKEYLILKETSILKINNIIENAPLLFNQFYIKKYNFTNSDIVETLSNSKIITEANLFNNKYLQYKDDIYEAIKCNKVHGCINVLKELHNIRKNTYQEFNTFVILEFVGITVSESIEYINTYNQSLNNSNEYKYAKLLEAFEIYPHKKGVNSHQINLVNRLDTYKYNFDSMLFQLIYTLYVYNTKLGIIHNDLHLNNITVKADKHITNLIVYYINAVSSQTANNAINNNKIYIHAHKVFKNIFTLSDKKKEQNTFVSTLTHYSFNVIDYNRAIINTDYNIFNLLEIINILYPFLEEDKPAYTKLLNKITNRKIYYELFKILTGYDVYTLTSNFNYVFTDEIKNTSSMPSIEHIKLVKDIKDFIYNLMYKNIMEIISNKDGIIQNYEYTNKIILYKFFDYMLLKNYKLDSFININEENTECYCLPKPETCIESYKLKKNMIVNYYNYNNKLLFTSLEEKFNSLYK